MSTLESTVEEMDRESGSPSRTAVPFGDSELTLADAKSAYFDLMTGYCQALGEASKVGRVGNEDVALTDIRGTAGWSYLIRLTAKAHVRTRLVELAAALAQIAATMPSGKPARGWIDGAREDCERIAGGLPRFRFQPILLAVISPAVALLSLQLPGWMGRVLLGLAAAIPALVFLGYLTVRSSYRCKREIFLPGACEIDRLDAAEQTACVDGNIYAAEDRAFKALGRRKRQEIELDRSILHVGLLLLCEIGAFLPYVLWEASFWWVGVSIGLVAVGIFRYLERFETRRVWR